MNRSLHAKPVATYLSFAAIVSLTPLFADEAPSDQEVVAGELAPYVVVATRTPLGLDRVSPSVSYIGVDEMEAWQDRSLVDVLQRSPGMAIWSNGAPGNLTSLSIRGTNSDQSSFFLDGRRINPGFENQFNISNLALNNLQSVQVQKGPSSVNYGSAGIGGAVALETVTAIDLQPGTSGSIGFESGANDYTRGFFDVRTTGDNFGLSLAGSSLNSENERVNDQIESHDFQARLDYRLSESLTLEMLSTYSDVDNQYPGVVGGSSFGNAQTLSWLISPGIKYATDTLSLHVFYSRTEMDVNEVSYSSWNDIKTDELNLQLDYTILDQSLVSFGILYRNDAFATSQPYAASLEQTGAWLQLQAYLTDDFELRAGVRYDRNSDFKNALTSNIELVYRLAENTDIFLKLGTSFAPPQALDIAYDDNLNALGATVDTPLRPEEAVSYELGLRQYFIDEKVRINFVAFRNEISDLIKYVDYDWPNTDTLNISSAKTEGVEFAATYSMTDKCDLSLGYTYLTAVDEDTDTRLVRRPRHMLQLAADYQFTDALHAGIQATGHFDREDIDPVTYLQVDGEDFFVVRLVADWAISDSVTLFARVENLLDETYAPAAGYPALGRAGYIGARWTF